MIKLSSFLFVVYGSTVISNVSSAEMILLTLVQKKQHQGKDPGPLHADRSVVRCSRKRNLPAAVSGPGRKCCLQSLNGRAKGNWGKIKYLNTSSQHWIFGQCKCNSKMRIQDFSGFLMLGTFLVFTKAILNHIEFIGINATQCGNFLFGISYFANRKSTFGSWHCLLVFSCIFVWLWVTFFNVATVLFAEPGKLCSLPHLLSVYKPCQRQLNT